VKVDGEPKGTISSGRLPIPNLADGKHKLVIEVGGFQRFEKEVTVAPNERNEVSVTLTRDPTQPDWKTHETTGSTSEGRRTNYWKGMFVSGAIVSAAGLSFWIVSKVLESNAASNIHGAGYVGVTDHPEVNPVTDADCGNPDVFTDSRTSQYKGDFDKACKYHKWTGYGIAGFSVGAVVMVATFYSAFLKDNTESSTPPKNARRKSQKPQFAITPVVNTDGGGATLRIDW
jgi:hypothetical protein